MSDRGKLALSGSGVRAVVVGTATHRSGSRLPDVPEALEAAQAVARGLTEHCGLPAGQLQLLLDPEGPEDLLDGVMAAAVEAVDVLLVYYVGHGVLSMSGELHLATKATKDLTLGKAAFQALRYSEVRDALLQCRAEVQVVILDCCFSGRAELPAGRGLVLASASGEQHALVAPGARYPAFTGELLDLLASGDPDGPPQLTLDYVDRYLKRRLRERGLPVPRMQDRERARDLVVAANASYRPPADWTPPDDDVQVENICPYQGLAAYSSDDARFFHGRERLTAELLNAVSAQAFSGGAVAVVGPSGSGKSSLLAAGLLPAIARGELDFAGSAGWLRMSLTPGPDPLRSLAAALPGPETPGVGPPQRMVLVVDQLEELFTQCRDDRARLAFVAALEAIADGQNGAGGLVVLGVRGDFYGHCLEYPWLKSVLSQRQVIAGPMTTAELREAIEVPARLTGHALEPGLVELLLRDMGCDPADENSTSYEAGSLPLLSHVLREAWRDRRGRVLTVRGYQAAGGVGHAIARTADRELAALPEPARDAVQRMLPRLVTVSGDAPDTLRRADHAEILAGLPTPAAGQYALQALATARLVTVDAPGVTITHEALIRSWPTLRGWIDADRDWLRATQQITGDARMWDADQREPSRLYRGALLAAMTQRAAIDRRGGELPEVAQEFLGAAMRQQRRAARRRRVVIAALAVITVLAVVAGGIAVWARGEALTQRDIAVARAVAAKAATFAETDPRLARQLTVAAHQMAPDDVEVSNAVLAAADIPMVADIGGRPSRPQARFTPDGAAVVVSHGRGFDIRDATTMKALSQATLASETAEESIRMGVVSDIDLTADGSLMAVAGQSGLGLWRLTDLRHPEPLSLREVPGLREEGKAPVTEAAVAMSPHGDLFAYDRGDRRIELLNTADPARPITVGTIARSDFLAARLRFSPDGHLLAALDREAGTVTLWDVRDPGKPRKRATLPGAYGDTLTGRHPAVEFGPHGLLAYSGDDNSVQLWSVRDRPKRVASIRGHADLVTALAFSADGTRLASGSRDESLQVTDVSTPGKPAVLGSTTGHTADITGIAFHPRRHALATVSQDTTVRLWPFDDPRRRPAIASISGEAATGVLTTNRDRTLLATGGAGSSPVHLWDTTTPASPRRLADVDVSGNAVAAAFDSGGKVLAVARDATNPTVVLIDTRQPRNARQVGSIPTIGRADGAPAIGEFTMSISGDSRLLAVGNMIGQIHLFDISTPSTPRPLGVIDRADPGDKDRLGWIVGLAFDPIRPRLTVSSWLTQTAVFDLSDPTRPRPLAHADKHQDEVFDVAVSPDSRWLASTDRIGTILLWDLWHLPERPRAFKPAYTLHAPSRDIPQIDFGPDGRLIAAVNDRTFRIWEIDPERGPTQTNNLNFADTGTSPGKVRFGPRGDTVLVASDDPAAIDVFGADADYLAQRMCVGAGRPLSGREWQQYLPDIPYQPPCR